MYMMHMEWMNSTTWSPAHEENFDDNVTRCGLQDNATCWHQRVHEMNASFATLMIPVIAMMILFMVTGSLGNSVVLLVYCRRRQKSSATIYMTFLAFIDLLSCMLIHPYVIYKLFHKYNQLWNVRCKVFEFLIHCMLALSGLTLLLIAIDRYFAICKPVKFIVIDKNTCTGIMIMTVLAIVISIPLFVFYGPAPFDIRFDGIIFVEYMCHVKNVYRESPAFFGFSIFIMSGFLSVIIAMSCLYWHVALTAYRSRRQVRPLSNAHLLAGIQPVTCVSTDAASQKSQKTTETVFNQSQVPNDAFSSSNPSTLDVVELSRRSWSNSSNRNQVEPGKSNVSPPSLNVVDGIIPQRTNINRTFNSNMKAAKILFLVTTVFFCSWMPFFIMRICSALNPNYLGTITDVKRVVESLLNHVFYLNNAANPILYTIINSKFRQELKITFRKCFRR